MMACWRSGAQQHFFLPTMQLRLLSLCSSTMQLHYVAPSFFQYLNYVAPPCHSVLPTMFVVHPSHMSTYQNIVHVLYCAVKNAVKMCVVLLYMCMYTSARCRTVLKSAAAVCRSSRLLTNDRFLPGHTHWHSGIVAHWHMPHCNATTIGLSGVHIEDSSSVNTQKHALSFRLYLYLYFYPYLCLCIN